MHVDALEPPHGASRRRAAARITSGELRLTLLGGLLIGLAYAEYSPTLFVEAASDETYHAVRAVVIDGDTFRYGGDWIRIADIDTPKVDGRCAYETELAARATQRLGQLLREGPFALERIDRDTDRYGRKLRIVTRGGRSIDDQLVSEGLARTWTGRREPWC